MNQDTSNIEASLKIFNEETLLYSKIMSILCNLNKDNDEHSIEELLSIVRTITPDTPEILNMILKMLSRVLLIRPQESKSIIRLLISIFDFIYSQHSSLKNIIRIFKYDWVLLDALFTNNIFTLKNLLQYNKVRYRFFSPDDVEKETLIRKFEDEFSLLIKGNNEKLKLEDYLKLASVVIKDDVDSLNWMEAGNYFEEDGFKSIRFEINNMLFCHIFNLHINCFYRGDSVCSSLEASVLGLAAFFGAEKIVRYSLMNEIPVNDDDRKMAIAGGYTGIVKLLEMSREYTNGIPHYTEDDLLTAVIYHRNEIADYIIQVWGVTVNPSILSISLDSYNFSFFMKYIVSLKMQELEEVFFCYNCTDDFNRTVYETAAENGNISIFNLIFNIFPGVFLDDIGYSSNKTPLFTAISKGNKNIAQLLINNGSSLFKSYQKCNTPFEKACKTGMKLSFSENISDTHCNLLFSETLAEKECTGYIFGGKNFPHVTGPKYLIYRFMPEYSDTFTRRTMEQLKSLQ